VQLASDSAAERRKASARLVVHGRDEQVLRRDAVLGGGRCHAAHTDPPEKTLLEDLNRDRRVRRHVARRRVRARQRACSQLIQSVACVNATACVPK
jgi:hypothetical protein